MDEGRQQIALLLLCKELHTVSNIGGLKVCFFVYLLFYETYLVLIRF